MSDHPYRRYVSKAGQQSLASCSSCETQYHPGCHLPFYLGLVDASERSCQKCKAQKQSQDLRHGMSCKKCSKCSKIFMMTTSGSEHCKQCQAKVKHEQSLGETESRRFAPRSTQAKKTMRPLFRKNHRPQIRTEKVGSANIGSQWTAVDFSASMMLPVSKEGNPTLSLKTSKRKYDQAFHTLEVSGNAVKFTDDPRPVRTMSFVPQQKAGLPASLEAHNIALNNEGREKEKSDESKENKEENERKAENDDIHQSSRIITHSLDCSGMYQRPFQPYLDRLYWSFLGIHNPLDPPKKVPPTIQGRSPVTFEAPDRANTSNYDESILDSYFYHGRTPLGPDALGKMIFLGNCARSRVVKQLVQDKGWYGHKQSEIKARGGRKGQRGKIITKEMFEERLANGWNKHQNKPILEKEQKNGDAILWFFGFPENMQPVLHDSKIAMADSALFVGGRTPNKAELVLGVNMWISQDE